jgi:hypothetical protein
MILGVRACLSLSGITSRTRQTHRTTEPCLGGCMAPHDQVHYLAERDRVCAMLKA